MTLARGALTILLASLTVSLAIPAPVTSTGPVAWLHLVPLDGWEARLDGPDLVPLTSNQATFDRDAEHIRVHADLAGHPKAFVLSPGDGIGTESARVHAFTGRLSIVWERDGTTATVELHLEDDHVRVLRFPGTRGVGEADDAGFACLARLERSPAGPYPLDASWGPLTFDFRLRPDQAGLLEFVKVGDFDCPVGAVAVRHLGQWNVTR